MAQYPGFCGPSYTSQSRIADGEKCINLFPEIIEMPGKNKIALYPTPGLDDFAVPDTPSIRPNRGSFSQDSHQFVIIGFVFYQIYPDGSLIQRGTVDADSNPATISHNGDGGNQLFITSGGAGYSYDLTTQILTHIAGLTASVGAFLDGFFLALDAVNSILRISDYLNGLSWDPTQFRVRIAGGDRWVAMIVIHRQIWLYGTETYEVWYNAGTAPFPFQPVPGEFYLQGAAAAFSLAALGESPAWLSTNAQGQGMVMLAQQYAPIRISNYAVEFAIQSYIRAGITIADARSMVYQEDGHVFLVLTFPTADATWVYDKTVSDALGIPVWHERGFWDSDLNIYTAWRPINHMYAFNKHLVGDLVTGQIYDMSTSHQYDAGGVAIRRVRRAPHVNNERKRIRITRFELDMEVGIGNATGAGVDPVVSMRVSRDGGWTWSSEFQMSAGRIGQYGARVFRYGLGQARDHVVEIIMSDPVPWRIVNAYIDVKADRS